MSASNGGRRRGGWRPGMGRRTVLELGLLLLALEPRGSSRVTSRLVLGMRQVELVRSVAHVDELVERTDEGRERDQGRGKGLGGTRREKAAGAELTSGLLSFDANSLSYDDLETCLDVDWQGKKELGEDVLSRRLGKQLESKVRSNLHPNAFHRPPSVKPYLGAERTLPELD